MGTAEGFYEWKGATPLNQRYFIHKPDHSLFCSAGLWERWRKSHDGEPVDTFTILSTEPNKLLGGILSRMPVILRPGDFAKWLDARTSAADVKKTLKPYPDGELEAYPVSSHVNNPKNGDPECVEPIE